MVGGEGMATMEWEVKCSACGSWWSERGCQDVSSVLEQEACLARSAVVFPPLAVLLSGEVLHTR